MSSSKDDNDDNMGSSHEERGSESLEAKEEEEVEEIDDDDDSDKNEDSRTATDELQQQKEKEREPKQQKKKRKIHKLSLNKTHDFNKALKKRGVLYVARIPPRMTPSKLKSLLEDFGPVTRVYCEPEDAAKRKRRRKLSGSGSAGSSKRYTEGWVEFASKRDAKMAAAAIHQQPISNFKRSRFYGDLWNVKYLGKHFAWSHLTEKTAYERRVREQKLRLETMQAKRETAQYKKLLETGQCIDKIQERLRSKKRKPEERDGNDGVTNSNDNNNNKQQRKNAAYQVQPVDPEKQAGRKALLGALV